MNDRETLASILRDCERRLKTARVKCSDSHVSPRALEHAVGLLLSAVEAADNAAKKIK